MLSALWPFRRAITNSVSARQIGDAVVICLPDAEQPAVWRFSGDHLALMSLHLREAGGFWQLEIQVPAMDEASAADARGESATVLGRYRSHDAARAALNAIAAALMRPQIGGAQAPVPSASDVWSRAYIQRPWMWATVPLLVLFGMMLFIFFVNRPITVAPPPDLAPQDAGSASDAQNGGAGQPQRADEFFRNRSD